MTKVKKITKEELEKATSLSKQYNEIIQILGNISLQKQDIEIEAIKVRDSVEEMKKELNSKYGNVNINIEDGSYTEIEVEEDKKD
jgi:hypothetical protein|tara:strand:+ start:273 stop:527 length:255 start_codon:yes stop_codon:yes gene_type:complete